MTPCLWVTGSRRSETTYYEVIAKYRVIRKPLRDVRPLWYSSRDGHAGGGGGGHVNRGRDTPSFCGSVRYTVRDLRLHRHNWLSLGKLHDTERSLIPCPRHVSSRLPPCGETSKYATAPITPPPPKKKLGEILYLLICSLLLCLSWLLRCRVWKFRRHVRITLYLGRCLIRTVCTVPQDF
jgi:hypothetical protein